MKFITAIQHATIGYGIRRKVWPENVIIYLENYELRYMNDANKNRTQGITGNNNEIQLLGPDQTFDLQAESVIATDWEAI